MAKHMVKCKFCEQQFDTNQEEWVAINERRYAHKSCYDAHRATKTQDELDYEELEECIKRIFNMTSLTAKIKRQIMNFRKEYGYSYTGMTKTLIWWFDIKKSSLEATNDGIGIIPWVYKDAYKYYETLFFAKMANEAMDMKNYRTEQVYLEIGSPRVQVKPIRLFNFDKIEEGISE